MVMIKGKSSVSLAVPSVALAKEGKFGVNQHPSLRDLCDLL